MSDAELLRSDVLELLDSDPVAPASEGLRARTRDLARRLARHGDPGELPPGARVGPYVVREVLGHGGQGTVYRAEDEAGRAFALKVPRPELVARLAREAQILFHLDHPRIVRIERAAIDDDPPHIACELLPGGTLADRLRQGRLPALQVAWIADQILDALAHGHDRGVVHRDIKPSNVLFDAEDRVKVADFGLGSLRLVEDVGLGQTLVTLDVTRGAGTPVYMAPEQADPSLRVDGKVDGRADLYALGKLLYEALTGRSPRTVRPPSSLLPGLEPAWDTFLFRLLEDRPQDRFATAAEARAALAVLRALPAYDALRPLAPAAGAGPARVTPALRWVFVGLLLGFAAGQAPLPGSGTRVALAVFFAVLAAAATLAAPRRARRAPAALPDDPLEELASALARLSKSRVGALIAIERTRALDAELATGTRLDAALSAELLSNVFWPGSPLHDGAVIVRGGRIAAAGCFLPLTDQPDLPRDLGTRHRAAIGLSERSDALVVVVSEETGRISLADGGRLVRDLTPAGVRAAIARGGAGP